MTATMVKLSRIDARALTDAIADSVASTWELVIEAYERRAWSALGYGSWSDYCTAEFSSMALPGAERSAIIGAMRAAGMSARGIGVAIGVSHTTVEREIATGTNVPVELPERIVGTDGRNRPASVPRTPRPKVIEDANAICEEFIRALKNMVALQSNIPFGEVHGDARQTRAAELRAVRDQLDQIIDQLETEIDV